MQITYERRGTVAAFMLMLCTVCMMLLPLMASAQPTSPPDPKDTSTTCTSLKDLAKSADANNPNTEKGIITNISQFIKDVVGTSSKKLFQAFTDSDTYKTAVYAAATLMITFYGVAFTIGVVQANFGQVLQRLIKLGIVFTIISPDGWQFFSDYVVTFFNDGTDYIIGKVMEIGTGIAFNPGDSPFLALDGMAKFILSADMIIAILGAVGDSGPYGLMMGGLMGFAFTGFVKLLIQGLKFYAISFIIRALLFGVAPIFFVFLLFDKTRPMFTGWVNTLVNTSLQPILYFTFISFFLVMIMGAATNMVKGKELCWVQYQIGGGSANAKSFWRFKDAGQAYPDAKDKDWRGGRDCLISGDASKCKEFDINILDLLTFLILVYVATQFAEVVDNIARDISNSSVNLDTGTKHDQHLAGKREGEGGGGGGGGTYQTSAGNAAPAGDRNSQTGDIIRKRR
jgi:type IV secretory pathway VirB6-like protein